MLAQLTIAQRMYATPPSTQNPKGEKPGLIVRETHTHICTRTHARRGKGKEGERGRDRYTQAYTRTHTCTDRRKEERGGELDTHPHIHMHACKQRESEKRKR